MLAPGKQQINVTVLVRSETHITSETMSASSGSSHAFDAVPTPTTMHILEYMTLNHVYLLDKFAPYLI